MAGGFDAAHVEPGGQAAQVGGQVAPVRPGVLAHPHLAVVGADPEHALAHRRLGERHDGAVGLGARARGHHLRRIVGGEVGTRLLPAVPAVVEPEEPLPSHPQHRRVVRREGERGVPVETVLGDPLAGGRTQHPLLPRREVHAAQAPALRLVVHDIGVGGVHGHVEAVPAAQAVPVAVGDAVVLGLVQPGLGLDARGARAAPGLVVLEPAVDVVGLAHVHRQVVELADRQVVEEVPGRGMVVAEIHAAVAAGQHPVAVLGIDPHGVEVGMQVLAAAGPERAAGVVGDPQVDPQQVDAPVVVGLDADLAEVERARRPRAQPGPVLAGVVAAEDAAGAAARVDGGDPPALVRLDHGVDDARVLAVDVEADAPGLGREPRSKLGPGPSAVAGLEDAAGGTPRRVRPGRAPPRVHRRVEHVRVGRVHRQVAGAGARVPLEAQCPRLAGVVRDVDTALGVLAPQVAQRGHEHGGAVGGIGDDAGDGVRGVEAQVVPGPAAVARAVDAVPPRGGVAAVGLAGPYPDHVGVLLPHRHGAHRGHRFLLEHGTPGGALVQGLEDAAGAERHVEGGGPLLDHRDIGDAPAHVRGTHRAPGELLERLGIGREPRRRRDRDGCRRARGGEGDGDQAEDERDGGGTRDGEAPARTAHAGNPPR